MMKNELQSEVKRWVGRVLKIQDAGIRHCSVMERLAGSSAPDLAETLNFILREAGSGQKSYMEILESLADLDELIQRKGLPFFSEVYAYSQKNSYQLVVNFLRRPPPKKGLKKDFFPDPNQLANEVTLGERRSMAASLNSNILERLLFDPDPLVIRRLLQNPRLTLPMVIRMAAKRPTKPGVLAEIFRSSRWIAHHELKVALVRNPYTLPEIALRLLPALHLQDLREVIEDTTLLPEIRSAAEELCFQRIRGSSAGGLDHRMLPPEEK